MNKENDKNQLIELDYWPHPITSEERCVVVGCPGQNLAEIMKGKLPHGVDAYAIVNGVRYPIEEWEHILESDNEPHLTTKTALAVVQFLHVNWVLNWVTLDNEQEILH